MEARLEVAGQAAALHQVQLLPLFSNPIHAGFPSPADDFLEGSLDLHLHLVRHPAATYFLRVSGDSMSGVGIYHDDLIIVDTSLEAKSGDIVVASLGGEFTLKRFIREGRRLLLVSENLEYEPIEVRSEDELNIWGVVKHTIHSF